MCIMAGLIGGCAGEPKSQKPAAGKGWVALCDGKTLDGWVRRGGEAVYVIEDGGILGESRPRQPNTFLCTARDYGDFELVLDFKVDADLNSGIQFRSLSVPTYQNGRVHGYQYEIDATARAYSGSIYDEARRGVFLANTEDNPAAKAALRQGEWNQARILAIGDRLQTWINGAPAVDVRDSVTRSGFIGLQVHDVGDRQDPLQVRWRNIWIREIGPDGK